MSSRARQKKGRKRSKGPVINSTKINGALKSLFDEVLDENKAATFRDVDKRRLINYHHLGQTVLRLAFNRYKSGQSLTLGSGRADAISIVSPTPPYVSERLNGLLALCTFQSVGAISPEDKNRVLCCGIVADGQVLQGSAAAAALYAALTAPGPVTADRALPSLLQYAHDIALEHEGKRRRSESRVCMLRLKPSAIFISLYEKGKPRAGTIGEHTDEAVAATTLFCLQQDERDNGRLVWIKGEKSIPVCYSPSQAVVMSPYVRHYVQHPEHGDRAVLVFFW